MADLDCESAETALQSLAAIYGTTQQRLNDFFGSLDLEHHYRQNNPVLSSDQELKRLLEQTVGPQRLDITRSFWFHLTRAKKGVTFSEGILPLDKSLPLVWAMLNELFAGTYHQARICQMQKEGVENFQYMLKTPEPLHWGPFAMLVKDVGKFAESAGNHDYLRTPEIVEDICSGYEARFGENIQSFVEQSLVPTVVKFWTSEPEHSYGLSSAIRYAYACRHNEGVPSSANTCFDGRGMHVPFVRIVYVEQPD